MKFKVNRKVMLEHLKSMYKVVPKSSTVQELKGFLLEANEDDGYVYVTANNLEAAVQRKFKADIENGGGFIVEARLLINMLTLLDGTFNRGVGSLVFHDNSFFTFSIEVH